MTPLLLDFALPTIFLEWPAMMAALVVVIALEYLIARKVCSLKDIAVANVVSTLAGIPLSNVMRLIVTVLLLRLFGIDCEECWSTILMYHTSARYHAWVAVAMLLLFDFGISAWMEYGVLRRRNPALAKGLLWKYSLLMNGASYGLLALAASVWNLL